MSYSRIPYIYSNGNEMFIDGQYVNEDLINILLYDLHKAYRKEELEERIELGRKAKERVTKESEVGLKYIREKYKNKTINSKEDLKKFREEAMKNKNKRL